MATYYSPSTRGFYHEEIHGGRLHRVIQPGWTRPTIDVTLQPGESIVAEINGELRQVVNEGSEPMHLTKVSDMSVEPPTIEVPNPDCKIPVDAVEISGEHYAALMAAQSNGGEIKPDEDGAPTAVFPPPETVETIRARALVDIRAQRAPMLDALGSIAGRAARRGDNATAAAADTAYDELLDITTLPAFLAAPTYDDMKAAVLARYYEIAEASPVAVQTVFREVFG